MKRARDKICRLCEKYLILVVSIDRKQIHLKSAI